MDFLVKSGEATLNDVIEIRRVLETEAARLAAQRASEDAIAEMQDALAKFERFNDEKAIQEDQRFHIAIANATGNPLFAFVLGALNELLRGLRMRTLAVPKGKDMALKTHYGVLDAIRNRDAERACKMTQMHLDHAEELLRESDGRVAGKRESRINLLVAGKRQEAP
jgi:GntR family transcriptional repressor for pyruvate dehydrogenase complex